MKKGKTKIFFDGIYNAFPMTNYPADKTFYNHIDEIWSIHLADMIDYKTSTNEGFKYNFIINDKFSKDVWTIRLKK